MLSLRGRSVHIGQSRLLLTAIRCLQVRRSSIAGNTTFYHRYVLRIFHASLFLRSKMSYLDGTANATLCDAVPRCFLSMSLVTASSRSISRDSRSSSFKYWGVTLARAFCHERIWFGKRL